MLNVSPHTQIIPNDREWIVYHSLFGRPIILDDEAYRFLMSFRDGASEGISATQPEILEELRNLSLLIDESEDERMRLHELHDIYQQQVASGAVINYLSLIMSEDCNFSCRYCIAQAFRLQRIKTEKSMRLEIAHQAINGFVDLIRRHNHPVAYINFGGGEPLLHAGKVAEIVGYCEQSYPDVRFRFAMNTNASLITSGVAEMFRQCKIQVATSLD